MYYITYYLLENNVHLSYVSMMQCNNGSIVLKNGETALHYAVYRGFMETVKALLFARSTAVNVVDKVTVNL